VDSSLGVSSSSQRQEEFKILKCQSYFILIKDVCSPLNCYCTEQDNCYSVWRNKTTVECLQEQDNRYSVWRNKTVRVSAGTRQPLQCLKEQDNHYNVWKNRTTTIVSERTGQPLQCLKEQDNSRNAWMNEIYTENFLWKLPWGKMTCKVCPYIKGRF